MICSIDIETKAGPGFEQYDKAALDHHRNEITQIAVSTEEGTWCFKTVQELNDWLKDMRSNNSLLIGGHNFKFDIKTLIEKGADLSFDDYQWDTMLQAVVSYEKIPEAWLQQYEEARVALNETLGAEIHRHAGQHSLKSLAPYRLGVEPFWEVADHDNSEYAVTDATYTRKLFLAQELLLKEQGTWAFYQEKLMKWARMIAKAEYTGIHINLPLLEKSATEAEAAAKTSKERLIELWQEPIEAWEKYQRSLIDARYADMELKARERAKTQKTIDKIPLKYQALKDKAYDQLEPFNMDSPSQLMWLFRDYYDLDVTTFEGDESTGKSVLNRLASEGRKDIEEFLSYRKNTKLAQAFFPSYREMQWDGKLHCNLNLNGTRTGRLSSSEPNLQQVPGELHRLFIAPEGYKLLCYDLSNIEPILIAYLTECPELCSLLISGRNFHDANVITFFDLDPEMDWSRIKKEYKAERDMAKEVGLSMLYGSGAKRIQESCQKRGFAKSFNDCKEMQQRFRKKYAAIYEYKKELDSKLEKGECVTNLVGRKFNIPNKDDVYMKGFNRMIQSSASDLLIESVAKADIQFKAQSLDATPLLFVHDETVVLVRDDHSKDAERILLNNMLGYKLTTQHGTIKLNAEGGIFNEWRK